MAVFARNVDVLSGKLILRITIVIKAKGLGKTLLIVTMLASRLELATVFVKVTGGASGRRAEECALVGFFCEQLIH